MFGVKKDTLKRGEYRNYTFRLPMHVPELTLSLVAERGCVCLYASNCSERPLPRLCQWTLLVDAEKQRHGTLMVRTSEHHFVSGLYHVGLYCVADASFSLACSSTAKGAVAAIPLPASPGRSQLAAATAAAASGGLGVSLSLSPRGAPHHSQQQQQLAASRLTKRPFIDAGLLEDALSARASMPREYMTPAQCGSSSAAATPSSAAASSPRSKWQAPGDQHYQNCLGSWHRSLRDRMGEEAATASWSSPRGRRIPATWSGGPGNATGAGGGAGQQGGPESPRQHAQSHLTPSWLGGPYA